MSLEKQKKSKHEILFGRENFILMAAGVGLIILGCLLMLGGKTTDPNVYNPEELYSFRRITLAPILILAGLITEIVAILKVPKHVEGVSDEQTK